MRITVTTGAPTRPSADLVVECDAATPVEDVIREIAASTGAGPAELTTVDGAGVAAGSPAGIALRHGSVIGGDLGSPLPEGPALHAAGGVDAGRMWPLIPGVHVIGRGASAAIGLSSASVSRAHADLCVSAGSLTLADRSSLNGCWAAGQRVSALHLLPGDVCRIGDTALGVPLPSCPPLVTTARDGRLEVNRAPRVRSQTTSPRFVRPAPPPQHPAPRLPWLAIVGPFVMGIALAMFMDPRFLLFSLLSPVMAGGQALSDRWHHRRQSRHTDEVHRAAVVELDQQLEAEHTAERRRRRAESPDPAAVMQIVATPNARLWERRPEHDDWLRVRLGLATLPSIHVVEGEDSARLLHDVPLTLDLPSHPVLGIAGPSQARRALGAWLVAQTATLHSPLDLRVIVIAPSSSDGWSWTRWLPHTEGEAQAPLRTDPRPALVVVDGPRNLRSEPGLVELLTNPGPHVVICLEELAEDLPGECVAVVRLTDGPAPRLDLSARDMPSVSGALPDLIPAEWPDQVARRLAPLVDATPGQGLAGLPTSVDWGGLIGLEGGADVDRLQALWSRPSMCVPLGVAADGPWQVDLTTDGPHALVAGTTGSGKSEALRALVAGLAARNPPHLLSFVLIDYKGGAAFGACADLPHVAGMVTDLDTALTERALASLGAELRRREALFASAGVDNLADYPGAKAGLEHLARLVIVVDEFATLAEELPDFVGGLVGIAQRGRSLGIHLVLATQRPEGCVSADIRANTALRICLSVAREPESRDVLDAPDAALIAPGLPGRGFARVGAAAVRAVQIARATGSPTRRTSPTGIAVFPVTEAVDRSTDTPALADEMAPGATELDLLVAAARTLVAMGGFSPARAPWLAPLPHAIVGEDDVWAIADVPERQCYVAVRADAAHQTRGSGHLAIVGAPRAGKTTAAISFLHAMVSSSTADDLHVYAIDDSGALAGLTDLPHCGAVVRTHDVDRLIRLVAMVSAEVHRRREGILSDAPAMVLLVDRWESAVDALEQRDGGRWADALYALVSDGAAAGLRVLAVIGGRAPSGRLAAAIDSTLVLRLADPSDCTMFGVPLRSWPREVPPGRGYLINPTDSHLVQVAVPRELPQLARAASRSPRRVDALPVSIDVVSAELLRRKPRSDSGACVLLGVGGDDLEPVDVDLVDAGPAFIVAGPARSGRSTALARLAEGLLSERIPVACLLARSSPLRDVPGIVVLEPDTSSSPLDHVLVCDDAELLEARQLALLERALREARDGGPTVLVGGTTEDLAAGFRGPLVDARRSRCGLILSPRSPHDGDLLGARLAQQGSAEPPPGRGVLVMRGQLTPIQVAGAATPPRRRTQPAANAVRAV